MHKKSNEALRPIDQRHFSYWQAFYLSFYSNLVYQDAAIRWRGIGLPYVLMLATLLSLPFTPSLLRTAYQLSLNEYIQPVLSLPPLTFQQGELKFDKPMPYLVANNQAEVVAIIDTTGQITKDALSNYPKLIWVLDKQQWHYKMALPDSGLRFSARKFNNQWISHTYSSALSGTLSASDWLKSTYFVNLSLIGFVVVYPAIWLFFVCQSLVFLFFLASLGQLFARILVRHKVGFLMSFRLVTLAATPMSFILVILVTFNQFKLGFELYLMALLAAYYTMAIISVKHSTRRIVLT